MKKVIIIAIFFCSIVHAQTQSDNVDQAPEFMKRKIVSISNNTLSNSPNSSLLNIKPKPILESKPDKINFYQLDGQVLNLVDNWKKELTKKIIDKLNLPVLPYLMASYDWKNQKIYNIKIGVTKTFKNILFGAEYHFDSGSASMYLKMSFSTPK